MLLCIPREQDILILTNFYRQNPQLNTGGFDSNLPELMVSICLDDKSLVGSISLFNITKESAEFGMSVFSRQYTSLVVPAATRFLFTAFKEIGFQKLYCKIFKANTRALTSALKAGFFIEKNDNPMVLSMTYEQFERRWGNKWDSKIQQNQKI